MNNSPDQYRAEWATLTGRAPSDVYIPEDIRPPALRETLASRGSRHWIHWNGWRWGVLVNGEWLYVSELPAGLGVEDCRQWIRKQIQE